MKACRQGRSSRSTAVIHAGRRSWWRSVIISAKAVTWPAVAFSCGLRAADRQAALGTVRARSLGGYVGGDAAAWPAGLPIAGRSRRCAW